MPKHSDEVIARYKKGQRYSPAALEKMKRKRLDTWVAKAVRVHGTRFDYSAVHKTFQRQKGPKVEIKCVLHQASFHCFPINHVNNDSGGCPKCFSLDRGKSRIQKKRQEFETFLRDEHPGNLELISEYVGIKENVTVKCLKHGSIKTVVADNIKHLGNWGCDECSLIAIQKATRISPEAMAERLAPKMPIGVELKKVFRDRSQKLKVLIHCVHHGEKVISAQYAQKTKYMCPDCGNANIGWTGKIIQWAENGDLTQIAKLAVMEIEVFGITAMKVGFTQRELSERYSHFLKKVIWASEMPALYAAQIELEIKLKFADEKDERIKKAGMRSGGRWAGDEEFYWFRNKDSIIRYIKKAVKNLAQSEPNYDFLIRELTGEFGNYIPRKKDLSNRPIPIFAIHPSTKEIVHRFPSIAAAQRELNASNISTALNSDLDSGKGRRLVRGFYWVKQSEYDINKLPTSHQRSIYNAKKIKCVETDKVFPTIRAAEVWARENGLPPSKIGEAARGKRKTAAGFHWKFV